jgi:hypothetical protein
MVNGCRPVHWDAIRSSAAYNSRGWFSPGNATHSNGREVNDNHHKSELKQPMSDTIETPAPAATRSRKRKLITPRSPRTIDPGVAAIRARASAEIKEYHRSQASAGILKTIIEKRLAQLTNGDRRKLLDVLQEIVTPALIEKGKL